MKTLFVGLLFVSTFAHAVDPQLEEIVRKYSSSLYNIQVGQTWNEHHYSKETETFEGQTRTHESSYLESSVILKVMGKDYYRFTQTLDTQTNVTTFKVVLEKDESGEAEPIKLDKIEVIGDVLTLSGSVKTEQYSGNLSLTKNLLSPIYCDSQNYETISSPVYSSESSYVSDCGPNISRASVKAINLKAVEFCDPANDDLCEIRDMSFLTSDL